MTTGYVGVDEGSTKFMATNEISEDGKTKSLQRQVPADSTGAEILPALESGNLAGIKTDLDTLAGAVSASKVNVNISSGNPTTMPSTVADGASVTLGAKADAKSTATDTTAVTVMQVLKEISYMEQNPASRAVTDGGGSFTVDNAGTFAVQAAQATAANLNATVVGTGTFAVQSTDSLNAKTLLTIQVAISASQTGATVLTPTSGKKACITDIIVSATTAGTFNLFDSTDSSTTAIGPKLYLAANGGWDHSFRTPWISAAANNVIKYTTGSVITGSIFIQYYEV